MLKIRLARVGKRNEPHYRVVVADQKRAVQKKFVELLGHYHPTYAEDTKKYIKILIKNFTSHSSRLTISFKNILTYFLWRKGKVDS